MHIPQSMDKTLVAEIDPHVWDSLFLFARCLPTEENQVSPLHIGKIGSYFDTFAHIRLLRRISRNDDIMHKKHCPDQTAAIHSFWRSARPQIRNSHHCISRLDNAFNILFQRSSPSVFRLWNRFRNISLSAVRIRHFIKMSFATFPLQTITSHYIRHGLGSCIRFLISKSVMWSYNNLFRTVPFIIFLFWHRSNHHPVYPAGIVIRSLNLVPTGVLQNFDRHTQ